MNPLLSNKDNPYQAVSFNKIKPSHFEPAFKVKIAEGKRLIKKIISNKEEPTFQNTIIPLELMIDDISRLELILFNLNSAETNKEIQNVTQRVSPLLTKFLIQTNINKKVFRRLEKIIETKHTTNLTPEEIRLLETSYLNMKRNGAGLSFIKKANLTRLQVKLSKLNLKFNENILAETNAFEYHTTNINDLSGLPENEIEAAALLAKSKGKDGWIVNLQFTSYGPFIKYANNRELREKLYKAFTSRGNNNNLTNNKGLIKKIINCRLKHAQILGYETFAHFVLEDRMAQSPQKVNTFIDTLHAASLPFAIKELDELKLYAKNSGFTQELMPWDIAYFSEKLKTDKFGFNESELKPYFQLEKVIEGVFDLANTLFGLSFIEVKDIQVYHPEVKTYLVNDKDGNYLSLLYADFHPRENKQSGAWMTEFLTQSNINGNSVRPHISICCNFTKPTNNEPSLLTFSEVNTFLHEFGHALHGILANTTFPSLSGTNVYHDFVELPSQLLENWGTETEWLQKFAFHYKTNEPIPEDLIKKVIESRNFQAGFHCERQLSFGMLDMAWHQIDTPIKDDIVAFEQEATKTTTHLPIHSGSSISTSFSHIFAGGYAVGYYGYKWAEVLDADAFSIFRENGIFNAEVAAKFRTEILEKGGSDHPLKLYINFRGKEPTIDALLLRSGLK